MRVPIGVPRGGVWGRVQGGAGGGFLVESKGKGEGVREVVGGGGTGKGTGKSMRKLCRNYPLAKPPFSFSPTEMCRKARQKIRRKIRHKSAMLRKGEKTLLRKRPVLLRANFVLTKDRKRPYYGIFVVSAQGGVLQ